jgi:hypothetical protein
MERENRPTTADIAGLEPVADDRTPRTDTDTDTRADGLEQQLGDERREPVGETAEPAEDRRLLEDDATTDVQTRWREIQGSFVDEPRRAVEDADALVADLMQRLADGFAQERSRLESQWDRGDEVSTEDLRVALQRYRSFFDRLLSA